MATPDLILVVNVKAFTERRARLEAQLARVGLREYAFVHDWDIGEWDAALDAKLFVGEAMTPAQKSCALKHVDAMKRVIAADARQALILEDDAEFLPDFADGLQVALDERARWPKPNVVYLGAGGNQYTPTARRRPGVHLYPNTKNRFTDSYLVDAEVARRRLDVIERIGIVWPIDHMFEQADREAGVDTLWFEDPIVEQGSKNGAFVSAIAPTQDRFLRSFRFRLKKTLRKSLSRWRG